MLLGEIYLRSRTGVLQLEREGERLGLAFREGRLVRAEALPRHGPQPWPVPAIEDELARHLTRALTELGIERRRNGKLKVYSREPLLEVVGWRDGEVAFAEAEIEDRTEPSEVTTEELVLESVRRLEVDAVRAGLGDLDRPLGLAVNPDFDRELSPTDAYILSRVDGKISATELVQLVPQATEDTERSLLGLVLTGVVEFLEAPPKPVPHHATPVAEAPVPIVPSEVDEEARVRVEPRRREVLEAAERLQTLSHFEILGVGEGATDQEIKQGFFRQAKRFHPDQFRDPGFADLADKVEAVFMRVGGAYEVLRDPESRQSYEAVLRRRRGSDRPLSRAAPAAAPATGPAIGPATGPGAPAPAAASEPGEAAVIDSAENAWMAEEAIHRAERLIQELRAWDAIQLLQAVIPRIYGKKQRERARVLLAKAYIKNPNWLRRGEELLQQVLVDDPQNAEAHFALGMLYKESGMSSRAVTMFKKTLELRPDHRTAQTELNSLSGPAFLRKLFGKG
jgi:tetratricopeptide (TPR) repeat protein